MVIETNRPATDSTKSILLASIQYSIQYTVCCMVHREHIRYAVQAGPNYALQNYTVQYTENTYNILLKRAPSLYYTLYKFSQIYPDIKRYLKYTEHVYGIHCKNSLKSTLAKIQILQNLHCCRIRTWLYTLDPVQCIRGGALSTFKCAVFLEVLHFVLFQRCEFLWICDACARAAYRQSQD